MVARMRKTEQQVNVGERAVSFAKAFPAFAVHAAVMSSSSPFPARDAACARRAPRAA